MVKLNKIYTRTGDKGETGLVDGSRMPKHAARMDAIGTVDEANSAIGIALLTIAAEDAAAMLARIQNELFDLGADLATPLDMADTGMALRILPGQVERLEHEIDAMNAGLSPLTSFILPGGTTAAAHLHLARATVRRAERAAVAAKDDGRGISEPALRYLNRLSDHLFTLCRVLNTQTGDVLWRPGATR